MQTIVVCSHCGTEMGSTFYCTGCGSSTGEIERVVVAK